MTWTTVPSEAHKEAASLSPRGVSIFGKDVQEIRTDGMRWKSGQLCYKADDVCLLSTEARVC